MILNLDLTTKYSEITSIAIGKFDSLHKGHMKVISNLDSQGALLIIGSHFNNSIVPLEYKERLLEIPIFILSLEMVKNMGTEEFNNLLKVIFPNLIKVVVGYDFRYGKGRTGNPKDLKKTFDSVVVVEKMTLNGKPIHTTYIKKMIDDTNFEVARDLIGRDYSLSGKIVSGQGLGKKELFPTINIDATNFYSPPNGVYASQTLLDNKYYDSISFVGHRYISDNKFAVETHLIGMESVDLEGIDEASILFIEKIRDNIKFDKVSLLKARIEKDIEEAMSIHKERR